MSTDLNVDIATLVGPLEDIPCESIGHSIQPTHHSENAAEGYARVACALCDYRVVKAYCGGFIAWLTSGGKALCPECATPFCAIDILGPVNK